MLLQDANRLHPNLQFTVHTLDENDNLLFSDKKKKMAAKKLDGCSSKKQKIQGCL